LLFENFRAIEKIFTQIRKVNRKFEIYGDNEKLVTEDHTGRWNVWKFQNTAYQIPDAMLKGKNICVKFRAMLETALVQCIIYVWFERIANHRRGGYRDCGPVLN
jgi:hypothetical protein